MLKGTLFLLPAVADEKEEMTYVKLLVGCVFGYEGKVKLFLFCCLYIILQLVKKLSEGRIMKHDKNYRRLYAIPGASDLLQDCR